VHNRPFVVEAELRNDVVVFVRNKLAETGPGGDRAPLTSLGQFRRFEARRKWSCLHCNARENSAMGIHLVWLCCGHLICAGTIERSAYCGCGAFRELRFSKAEDSYRWEVRGTRPRSRLAPADALRIANSPATPRLTAGEPPLRLPWMK
jgi:hypothetical protein